MSDAETRRIGFAQPRSPGSVIAFVVPHTTGKAKAVGAPARAVHSFEYLAPHGGVRRPILTKLTLNSAGDFGELSQAATRPRPFVLRVARDATLQFFSGVFT
jgi:hypothetical protein